MNFKTRDLLHGRNFVQKIDLFGISIYEKLFNLNLRATKKFYRIEISSARSGFISRFCRLLHKILGDYSLYQLSLINSGFCCIFFFFNVKYIGFSKRHQHVKHFILVGVKFINDHPT